MPGTSSFTSLFGHSRPFIGMIHVGALPGTPTAAAGMPALVERALAEAAIYREGGADALLLENMHDLPYLKRSVGPEIVAAMSVIAREVKRQSGLPCGVQVLAGANRAAMAVALAADLQFVRAEGFVFAHTADEGIIESDAGALLRYRRQIGAGHIAVFADIKKKHSAHALTADLSLEETARAAAFFLADALILTGSATGQAANPEEVRAVREAVDLPILIGSGVSPGNAAEFAPYCNGFIVGSWCKEGGHWANPLDPVRVRQLAAAIHR
ncbi:MAG: BtpA/SgcQ family protein [Saprospiraceae bacterium]|nr:BtpA/SgcQ family protein [Saprospiraceae bacterium]MCB0626910.1 BtpA/SgcQ family protein [Saprospiraceae bacterium]MCB0675950.1 BtpA/SgcQ family protein [Saprospiraceae bacterium]